MPLPSSKDFGTTLVLLLINIFDFQKLKVWYLLWPSDTKQASKQPCRGSIFVDENTFSFIYVNKKTISFGIYNVIASNAIKSCQIISISLFCCYCFIFPFKLFLRQSLFRLFSLGCKIFFTLLEFHSILNKWCPFLGFRFQLSVCTTVWPPKRC